MRHLREQGSNVLLATGDGCWDLDGFVRAAGAAATEGEGTLVSSATPQIGEVRGSREFAALSSAGTGPSPATRSTPTTPPACSCARS
ncbi:hypothetical protein [Nonomuraea sp. NPDC049695]|uniref:hypothetical protein n=1 Tax=Nonomuraea sp. NPDC049695 TaxID=3154734 RepID=UPI00344198B8